MSLGSVGQLNRVKMLFFKVKEESIFLGGLM